MSGSVEAAGAWAPRLLVLSGRGASGLLPMALLAVASSALGLESMGAFASALAVALALAEVADLASQRHLPRLAASPDGPSRTGRFGVLRWVVLGLGLLPALAAVVLTTPHGARQACGLVVLGAIPTLGVNGVYARALRDRRFLVLAAGPTVALAVTVTSTFWLLQGGRVAGLWAPAFGLLLGRLAEWLAGSLWLGPAFPRSGAAGVWSEWRSVRYLGYQAVLSAANARLIVPLAGVVSGAAAAGLLSVGITLLSIVSLAAVAVTLPAYHSAVGREAPGSPAAAFRRVRSHWVVALAAGTALTAILYAATPWLMNNLFHLTLAREIWPVRLVIVAGVPEALSVFAGSLFHAAFDDRRLFHRSAVNAALGLAGVGLGGWLGGVAGMAWGFLVSRIAGVVVLYAAVRGVPVAEAGDAAGRTPASRRLLLALPQGAESPAPRYRVLQYVPYLAEQGWACRVLVMHDPVATRRAVRAAVAGPLAHAWSRGSTWLALQRFQVTLLREIGRHDRVLLHRIPISGWAVPLFRAHRERLVFDFDDALYSAEPEGVGPLSALRQRVLRRGLLNAIGACRTVVTSNERNAGFVRSAGGTAVVIPTAVDAQRIQLRLRCTLTRPRPVLGWMGTPSTAKYLTLVEEALVEVVGRHGVVVRLVGAGRNPFTRLDVELREWSIDTELAELDAFDIGLMPMPDTEWTRGKAALKALQYGASGAPAVVSWTPTNEAILGDAGALLCRTTADWITALEDLLRDSALRVRLGGRGRQLVVSRFSIPVTAPMLASVLSEGMATAAAERVP